MRVLVMVGDERTSSEAMKVADLFSAQRWITAAYFDSSIDDPLANGDEVIVLWHGDLLGHQMDVVDRAMELGVPVLEYK